MKNSPETLLKRYTLKQMWKATIDPATIKLYIKKVCKQCKKVKVCKWATTFTQTGVPEYKSRCIICNRKFVRLQQKRFRKRISYTAKIRKKIRKKYCVDYLGGKCIKCGYSKYLSALTFHHKVKSQKERDIAAMLDWSLNKLNKELDKCILVCFNCHMEIEEKIDLNKGDGDAN